MGMSMGMGMGTMAPTRTQSYTGPAAMQPQNPMFGSSVMTPAMTPSAAPSRSTPGIGTAGAGAKPAATGAKSSGNFDDLWAMSLGSSGSASKSSTPAPAVQNKSIKDLAQEKAQAGIWGNGASQNKPPMGAGFGAFGAPANNAAPPSSNGGGNGIDDLLF